jgi:transposase-like protein
MSKRISDKTKEKIAKLVLYRSEHDTIKAIAAKMSVSLSTVNRSVQQYKDKNQIPVAKEKMPEQWSQQERLQAVLDSYHLAAEEQSAYCRRNGIYPHHISQWHQQIQNNQMDKRIVEKIENKRLKAENKALRKEIAKKDQALSEAATLLLLKKRLEEAC